MRVFVDEIEWQGENDIENLPRQQVAFLEKSWKIKGCGSLREDFYTRFIPEK